jgi:hypothetical protein
VIEYFLLIGGAPVFTGKVVIVVFLFYKACDSSKKNKVVFLFYELLWISFFNIYIYIILFFNL